MELGERGKGKESDRASIISQNITSVKVDNKGCVLKAVGKWGMGGKEEGKEMEGFEQTKVKYIHSRDTLRNPFEHQLTY
jgi:hypothetical protein